MNRVIPFARPATKPDEPTEYIVCPHVEKLAKEQATQQARLELNHYLDRFDRAFVVRLYADLWRLAMGGGNAGR